MAIWAHCPLCEMIARIWADGWRRCGKRQVWRFVEHETASGKMCSGPADGV